MKATILCMKWGDKYPPEYVNRLYRMVSRHLSLPFDMVCLTDDAQGIDPSIRCLPIPNLDLPAHLPERGWKKLAVFSPELEFSGPVLFLDVDIVVIGSLDDFLTLPARPDEILIIRDWKKPWRLIGNSSVYRFNPGAMPGIWGYFRAHFADIRQKFRNEQGFLSWYARTFHHLDYWPQDWCLSYKYQVLKRLPESLWRAPERPAVGKVIVFHGEVNPPDAITGGGGKWYRKILPAPWLAKEWR